MIYTCSAIHKTPAKPAMPARAAIPAPFIFAATLVNCAGGLVVKDPLDVGMTGAFAVGRTIEVVGTVGVAVMPDGGAMTAPEVNTEEDLMAEGRGDGEEEGTKVLDALIRETVREYDRAQAPRSTPSGQQ